MSVPRILVHLAALGTGRPSSKLWTLENLAVKIITVAINVVWHSYEEVGERQNHNKKVCQKE